MNKSKATDEKQLIAECLKGKSWAQKELYDKYSATMMSLCVRYVTEREVARDVLQDGFVKLFTKLDTYSGVGAFGGWVRRIFVTTALEYLRQNDTAKQSISIDEVDFAIENNDVSIVEKISADNLLQMITALPDNYRTVFNLYAIEGYSHAEIAEMLKISEVNSRANFLRARKMLQNKILSHF